MIAFSKLVEVVRSMDDLTQSDGIVPIDVEVRGPALPALSRLGSGCRIREGEQRNDESYHDFTDRAGAWRRSGLVRCGQLIRALLSDGRHRGD